MEINNVETTSQKNTKIRTNVIQDHQINPEVGINRVIQIKTTLAIKNITIRKIKIDQTKIIFSSQSLNQLK